MLVGHKSRERVVIESSLIGPDARRVGDQLRVAGNYRERSRSCDSTATSQTITGRHRNGGVIDVFISYKICQRVVIKGSLIGPDTRRVGYELGISGNYRERPRSRYRTATSQTITAV
jgi:hypothetical protein